MVKVEMLLYRLVPRHCSDISTATTISPQPSILAYYYQWYNPTCASFAMNGHIYDQKTCIIDVKKHVLLAGNMLPFYIL